MQCKLIVCHTHSLIACLLEAEHKHLSPSSFSAACIISRGDLCAQGCQNTSCSKSARMGSNRGQKDDLECKLSSCSIQDTESELSSSNAYVL